MGWYAGLHIHGDASFAYQPFLIPAVPGSGPEIRGNGEMYPLNGPSWSLFFEYIGEYYVCVVLFAGCQRRRLRRLSCWRESGLASFAIFNFSGVGPSGCGGGRMEEYNLIGGFLRVLFSFFYRIINVARF